MFQSETVGTLNGGGEISWPFPESSHVLRFYSHLLVARLHPSCSHAKGVVTNYGEVGATKPEGEGGGGK